jgi:hypothetical protein
MTPASPQIPSLPLSCGEKVPPIGEPEHRARDDEQGRTVDRRRDLDATWPGPLRYPLGPAEQWAMNVEVRRWHFLHVEPAGPHMNRCANRYGAAAPPEYPVHRQGSGGRTRRPGLGISQRTR